MLRTTRAAILFVVVMLLLPVPVAMAQVAANPLPLLVVKDGDGKTVGQVLDLSCDEGGTSGCYPRIALNVAGEPAILIVDSWGPRAPVYFANTNCMGPAYLDAYPTGSGLVKWNTQVGVVGPDQSSGTYVVYRSSSTTASSTTTLSWWTRTSPVCENWSHTNLKFPAEELAPNPLGGFHGPTSTEPDKTWSISGGTRVTPP